MRSWYNWAIVLLIAATLADVVFGLDAVLNAVSTIFAVGLGLLVVGGVGAAVTALGWIVIRDAVDEIKTDRKNGIPWRWRCVGWVGIAGILADGVVGAWNAYQEHILFSTAVEQIPFAGVPVLLVLASLPFRWIEEFLMRRRRRRTGGARGPYGAR